MAVLRLVDSSEGFIQEAIPKLLKDLNLETKIKNKVHEILDRNGYFREVSTVT